MANFYTDNIKTDDRFDSTSVISDLELLEPNMRRKVLRIMDDAKAHGIDLMVFETYRSQQRQEQLFHQGATKLRRVGVHQYGLACDLVKNVGGKPSWKGSFDLLGHLAKAHNLIWGGDWGRPDMHHDFIDNVHVQWCSIHDQAQLFNGTWYPSADYDPYAHL